MGYAIIDTQAHDVDRYELLRRCSVVRPPNAERPGKVSPIDPKNRAASFNRLGDRAIR